MAGEQPTIDESKIGAAAAAGVADALKPHFDAILQKIAKPAEPAPEKTYTRAELDSAVAKGSLSQAQADQIIERQSAAAIEAKVEKAVETKIAERTQSGTVGAKMARYRELVPDLADEKSKVSQRCAAVYQELIDEGLPANRATALAAVKQVCGALDALEAAKTAGQRETSEEAGAGHGGASVPAGAPASIFKGIPNRFREHYAKGLEKGLYRGWDDPDLKAELDLVRTRYARAN